MNQFFVYLIESTNKYTYIGATIDLAHRLRQHNCEIKGGAIATSTRVKKGETWEKICHVSGFPDWKSALQFEWRWKQISRKLPTAMLPRERRLNALTMLLNLEKPTSKSVPYSEWVNFPKVIMDAEK